MGCDTSKESVQQAAEDTDKDEPKGGAAAAAAAAVAAAEALAGKEQKRLKSSGDGEPSRSEAAFPSSEEENRLASSNEEEEEAATRIQAVFRGHHARKSMKAAADVARTGVKLVESSEPSQQQLRDEFRADDEELCHAATKIQASFRGHMSRKGETAAAMLGELADSATAKLVDGTSAAAAAAAAAAAKIEEKMDDALNELDGIDLKDPDLHKAATKIQASFRGHKVRQEVTPGGGTPITE